MTLFNYNNNVPFTTNNPSVDQPQMLINTQSISGIVAVDHIGFSANNGGTHVQTTFVSSTTPTPPTGVASVAYPTNGIAAPTIPNYAFQNANSIFLLNSIRAFALFQSAAGPVTTFLNQFGFASISGSNTLYNLTVNANVVTGNNVIVFASMNATSGLVPIYAFAGGVLGIQIPLAAIGVNISVMLLQA